MIFKRIVLILAMFALTIPLAAQMGFGPRTQGLNGIWHPIVGSGGAYETTDRNGNKSRLEIAIVGKEDVDGKANYWMELKWPTRVPAAICTLKLSCPSEMRRSRPPERLYKCPVAIRWK